MSDETIFAEALALADPAARAAYLDRVCDAQARREIESLLAAHARDNLLDRPLVTAAQTATDLGPAALLTITETAPAGLIAGRYRLGVPLGQGGMGTVYRAEQEAPVRRAVAVKLIRPGLGTGQALARFEAERQALALMDHPGIAQVFDAGSLPDGRPFVVMELVDGPPLTRYCDDRRLTVPERLHLFAQIGRAVQHAHQKAVIHRDLKPSNILVAEVDGKPLPKVIDFGLAKALAADVLPDVSVVGRPTVVGTPLYMAPEQTGRGDVDTRADVYALGVVLYELLTGTTPLAEETLRGASFEDITRLIRETEPPTPLTRLGSDAALSDRAAARRVEPARLKSLVRGDLEWVTMKCLEKDRDRRYETVAALVQDVERYLADEPVLAGPPGRWYRASKFVRRNRLTVATAGAVAASLVIGTVLATVGLVEARRQTHIAEGETLKAQAAAAAEQAANQLTRKRLVQVENGTAALMGIFTDLDIRDIRAGSRPLEAVLAARLLATGERLTGDAVDDPLRAATLQHQLGITLLNLGFPKESLRLFERAEATRTEHAGADSLDAITSREMVAFAAMEAGDLDRARPLFDEVFRRRTELQGENHPETLVAENNRGTVLRQAGRPREAIPIYQDVLDRWRTHHPAERVRRLPALHNLATCYIDLRQPRQALPLLEEAMRERTAVLGPGHYDTLSTRNSLAAVYLELRQFDKAVPLLEATYADRKERHGADHPDTALSLNNLASAYQQSGDPAKALPLLEEALRLNRLKRGPDHTVTLASLNNVAGARWALKQLDQSVPLFEELVRRRQATSGPDHPDTRLAMANLGINYRDAKRYDQAIPLLKEVHEASATDPGLEWVSKHLLNAYVKAGRAAEAKAVAAELAARSRRSLPPGSTALANALDDIAYELIGVGGFAEAEVLLKESLAVRENRQPDSWSRFGTQADYGAALVGLKRYAEAEPLLVAAFDGLTKHRAKVKSPQNRLRETAQSLVQVYTGLGKPDKVTEWQAKRDQPGPK